MVQPLRFKVNETPALFLPTPQGTLPGLGWKVFPCPRSILAGGVWVWWTGGGRPLVAPWSVEWSEQAGTGPHGLQLQCTGFRAYAATKFSLDGRGPHAHLSPCPLAWWVLSLLHARSLVISAPPGQGEEAVPEASPPPWASKQAPKTEPGTRECRFGGLGRTPTPTCREKPLGGAQGCRAW